VDDNPAAREVLSDMARRLGLNVEVADSGPTALRRMEQAAFEGKPHHLLLTDWKMPGMDGIEFAKHALELPPEQRPCVLLVTAFARDEALKAAEGVPLAGVLNKPVTPSTLLDTIGRALGKDSPAPPVVRSGAKALEKAQRHLAGARVLLVEDQAMNLELATDLLQRAGLSVVAAHDGQHALHILEQDAQFDGVLMDCQMPVMDGYEAAQRIRSSDAWRHLPIIAMTASAMAADRERVLASGMDDHITKPLDLMQMFTIMARWITPRHRTALPGAEDAQADPLPRTLTLDTADGLNRCMGNLDLYRRLLKGFAKTQAKVGDELGTSTQGGQWPQVYSLAHSLKGLSGNIGAHELAELADALEQASQREEGDAVQALVPQVQAMLRDVVRDIGVLTQGPSPQPPTQPGPDEATLQPWWARLSRLMQQHEAEARDVMDEMLSQMPGIRRWPLALALREALQRYDFDEATLLFSQWQQAVREGTPG
jgi:two-component system, sensor histidine kinase and response regulator